MRITFLSTEVFPYAKTGGLGDVAAALPKALAAQGIDVDIIMPRYSFIDAGAFGLTKQTSRMVMNVRLGYGNEGVGVWRATLPDSRVQVYFIEHFWFFDRPGLYGDHLTGGDYSDNPARFAYFCQASLEIIRAFDLKPNLIHCNDYQTALVPAYLRLRHAMDPFLAGVATLYTIHNMQYQGRYPRAAMEVINIGYEHFYPESPFEYWDQVNFMKAGLVYADMLSTVSPRYAREIQNSSELGHGLDGVLCHRSAELHGIINGIDFDLWNPASDPLIPIHYDAGNLEGKTGNKMALLQEFGLTGSPDTPVIGIVSRLASQKGFDIIGPILQPLLEKDVRLVVLGTGETRYHDMFLWAASTFPDKIGARLTFDNRLAHLVEAGSDLFLMPSLYEPCGLNQLYSLRYGALPVVRETGGLADTVRNYHRDGSDGTGFVFRDYHPEALLATINLALDIYRNNPALWKTMMRHAMSEDFSWNASAKHYIHLYDTTIRKKIGSHRRGRPPG